MYFTQKFLRAKTVFHAKVARNFSVKCEMVGNVLLKPTLSLNGGQQKPVTHPTNHEYFFKYL